MLLTRWTASLAILVASARADFAITYPGSRGNNEVTNGTLASQDPSSVGVDYSNGSFSYPYGMQHLYPCGGLPLSTKRLKWPVSGGAVAVQTSWTAAFPRAWVYVNIGIQAPGDLNPPNMSFPVVPPFQVLGSTGDNYNGSFCIPQIGMPSTVSLSTGQNITLQVVEAAIDGSAQYSCVDLTLVDNLDPGIELVTPSNCFNNSGVSFQTVFTSTSLSAAIPSLSRPSLLVVALTTIMCGLVVLLS